MATEPFPPEGAGLPGSPIDTLRRPKNYVEYGDGTIYEGDMVQGIRQGLGVCFYPSGNIYVGQFRNGSMEGEGTMFFDSGEFFSGEFRKSNIYKGVYSNRGKEIKGIWLDGSRIEEFPMDIPEGLQRLHAELFAKIVETVHDHFRVYAAQGVQALKLAPSVASAGHIAPPTDIASQSSHHLAKTPRGRQEPSTSRMALPSALTAVADANSSFSGPLQRATSSIAGDDKAPDLRAMLTKAASPRTIFACAAPATNEFFSLPKFGLRLFEFLFPFFSLPQFPFAPLRITTLEAERDFVVSGATLRRDFDPPTISIYVIAVAVCCQVAAIVIVACKVKLGTPQDGHLTLPEMVIPCVLWLLLALFLASYTAYLRLPHSLERMDRQLTPRLSAFAASVVDARAKVCIYTWDDEGRGKVMNRHYRYRWLLFAGAMGAAMSLSAPATRGGFGHAMFGRKGFEMAAALLSFFATFLFSTLLSYYVLKVTDMQREICAKMRVLTDIAFLENHSIAHPTVHSSQTFNFDIEFDPEDLFHGFPGWYTARSLVLYASTSANHSSRGTAMSFFALLVFCVELVTISDVFYMLANGYNRNKHYYSTAHSYAVFVLIAWGFILFRYMYVSACSRREEKKHLYIMDIGSMYHFLKREDVEATEVMKQCRAMADAHDARPRLFGAPMHPLLVILLGLFNLAGVAAVAFQLGEVIYFQ